MDHLIFLSSRDWPGEGRTNKSGGQMKELPWFLCSSPLPQLLFYFGDLTIIFASASTFCIAMFSGEGTYSNAMGEGLIVSPLLPWVYLIVLLHAALKGINRNINRWQCVGWKKKWSWIFSNCILTVKKISYCQHHMYACKLYHSGNILSYILSNILFM